MLKPTKRKAFNFLRSYYDVLNELQNDKDKLNFLLAIMNKQFLDEDPKDLNFIVNLCYASQKHAIESSVKGWKRVNKDNPMTDPPTDPPTIPQTDPKEEKEKEKVKDKEEVKEELLYPFQEIEFKESWNEWKDFKRTEKKFNWKSTKSEQKALNNLKEISKGNYLTAIKIIDQSIVNGWSGLFELKNVTNGNTIRTNRLTVDEQLAERNRIFEKNLNDSITANMDRSQDDGFESGQFTNFDAV